MNFYSGIGKKAVVRRVSLLLILFSFLQIPVFAGGEAEISNAETKREPSQNTGGEQKMVGTVAEPLANIPFPGRIFLNGELEIDWAGIMVGRYGGYAQLPYPSINVFSLAGLVEGNGLEPREGVSYMPIGQLGFRGFWSAIVFKELRTLRLGNNLAIGPLMLGTSLVNVSSIAYEGGSYQGTSYFGPFPVVEGDADSLKISSYGTPYQVSVGLLSRFEIAMPVFLNINPKRHPITQGLEITPMVIFDATNPSIVSFTLGFGLRKSFENDSKRYSMLGGVQ